ncbi:hypothetical protein V1525DRAFT_342374 [Lipomyces kononenkoae]|uniref:Uncharacterized protein n=1 Tax=Lipomyces kononenkoae TaxID=34357 RepID=A0ACC3T2F3_LIPKO
MSRPARAYLKSATKLLEVLFILMHVMYGSPARMTEISTWTHVNSVHGSRNVYYHSRALIFLGLYDKTTSLAGVERFIVHLIPSRLERLLLGYLIYIRPFEKYRIARLYP